MSIQSIFQNNQTLLLLASLWVLPWKGVALWKSARAQQQWWFIVLLLVNTLAPTMGKKKGFTLPWRK
jgi:methionyl-tRNA synthetase